jgi:pilus assembly protein CpaB
MLQHRTGPLLAIALACGLLAGYLTLNLLRGQNLAVAAMPAETTPVVVAAADLPPGSVLGPQDVEVVAWPTGSLPEEYATSVADVVGRGVLLPIMASEPLLRSKLADPGSGGGLSITIPHGMRAVSIEVDEVVGVAGFVLPGTRVDVVATFPAGVLDGVVGGTVSRVILQSVQVLAAGQRVDHDLAGKPLTVQVITLLVTPVEAERLALAANEGRLQLALRNTLDIDSVTTQGVQTLSLIGSGRVRAVEAAPQEPSATPIESNVPERPMHVVETYRGADRTISSFERGVR